MSSELGTIDQPFKTWAAWCDTLHRYRRGEDVIDPRLSRPGHRHYLVTRTLETGSEEEQQQEDGGSVPCVSAWHQYTRGLEGQPPEAFGEGDGTWDMPWVGFQVYVPWPATRSSSSSQGDLAAIASALETKTFKIRHGDEISARNRLDVYKINVFVAEMADVALGEVTRRAARDFESTWRSHREMEADEKELPQNAMLLRCVAHQRAKLAAAKAAGRKDFQWGNSPKVDAKFYQHSVIVLQKVPDGRR